MAKFITGSALRDRFAEINGKEDVPKIQKIHKTKLKFGSLKD